MKRPSPKVVYPNKAKSIDKKATRARLTFAAERASFAPSDYHCPNEQTRRPKWRPRPAMHCPRVWSLREGINAVRQAILAGRVSASWTDAGFPRHIWHQEGEVWYEARTTPGTPGVYHGYPVEISALPAGLDG